MKEGEMREATEEDFKEDLELTVRELLTRGVTTRTINGIVKRALKDGPFQN